MPLSKRGRTALGRLRGERPDTVHPDATVLLREGGGARWWTYAGSAVNASLAAAMSSAGTDAAPDAFGITLGSDVGEPDAGSVLRSARSHLGAVPSVTPEALEGLKFSAALPLPVAADVLARRMTDRVGAAAVCQAPVRMVVA